MAAQGNGPTRARRWLAVSVVLVAVPALLATSPDDHPISDEETSREFILDAAQPAVALIGTVEMAKGSEGFVSVAVDVDAAGAGPQPVQIVMTPVGEPGEAVTWQPQEFQRLPLRCGDVCRTRITVQLADAPSASWRGRITVTVTSKSRGDGGIVLTLAPDEKAPAPTQLHPPPLATAPAGEEPQNALVPPLSQSFLVRNQPPSMSWAVVGRVTGSVDAVRRLRLHLRAARGTTSLLYRDDTTSTGAFGHDFAVDPGATCGQGDGSCRDQFAIVSIHEPVDVTIESLTAPVSGVDVELVRGAWLRYDQVDGANPPYDIPVPPGWEVLAQAEDGTPNHSALPSNHPPRLLRHTPSGVESIGGPQPSLVPVMACPASSNADCTVTLQADVGEQGLLNVVLVPTKP